MTNETPATDALRRFTTRDFAAWPGLLAGTTRADVASVLVDDGDAPASGSLGSELRPAGWVGVEADGFDRGLRVWLDRGSVILIEGESPAVDGSLQTLLDTLGEPEAKLGSYIGPFLLDSSEWVWPERGLTLYLNPDNLTFLCAAGYAPTTLDEYERRLRLNLQTVRMQPGGRL